MLLAHIFRANDLARQLHHVCVEELGMQVHAVDLAGCLGPEALAGIHAGYNVQLLICTRIGTAQEAVLLKRLQPVLQPFRPEEGTRESWWVDDEDEFLGSYGGLFEEGGVGVGQVRGLGERPDLLKVGKVSRWRGRTGKGIDFKVGEVSCRRGRKGKGIECPQVEASCVLGEVL